MIIAVDHYRYAQENPKATMIRSEIKLYMSISSMAVFNVPLISGVMYRESSFAF